MAADAPELVGEGVRIGTVMCEQACPPPDCVDATRPVAEYSGYTYHHLPDCPKNTVAMLASLAARIAFSNLRIRWELK